MDDKYTITTFHISTRTAVDQHAAKGSNRINDT